LPRGLRRGVTTAPPFEPRFCLAGDSFAAAAAALEGDLDAAFDGDDFDGDAAALALALALAADALAAPRFPRGDRRVAP
jgi:hypothetical protein